MKLLLDTHIILWALDDNPKLSSQARELIVDAGQVHNDPFDRIMIAQAKADGLKFITHDSKIPLYEESCVIPV